MSNEKTKDLEEIKVILKYLFDKYYYNTEFSPKDLILIEKCIELIEED